MMRFQNNLHLVRLMLNREKPVMMRFQNNLHLVRSMLNREKPVMMRFQNNLHLVRSMLNREKPNDFKVFVKWKTEEPRYNLITPLVSSNFSSDSKIQ